MEQLCQDSQIVIDRPKGSGHPRFPDVIYPLDYGYLAGTTTSDNDGVDIWLGSQNRERSIGGVLVTVDLMKRDTEIKVLINCTQEEIEIAMQFTHDNNMGCLLVPR